MLLISVPPIYAGGSSIDINVTVMPRGSFKLPVKVPAQRLCNDTIYRIYIELHIQLKGQWLKISIKAFEGHRNSSFSGKFPSMTLDLFRLYPRTFISKLICVEISFENAKPNISDERSA